MLEQILAPEQYASNVETRPGSGQRVEFALKLPGQQRDFKVVVTGPTTLATLLNSLHIGFRTLGIEKRSSEVWDLLGTVRTEFSHFGAILEKTRKKLQEAGNQIEQAVIRGRAIERKLRDVQSLLTQTSECLLETGPWNDEEGAL